MRVESLEPAREISPAAAGAASTAVRERGGKDGDARKRERAPLHLVEAVLAVGFGLHLHLHHHRVRPGHIAQHGRCLVPGARTKVSRLNRRRWMAARPATLPWLPQPATTLQSFRALRRTGSCSPISTRSAPSLLSPPANGGTQPINARDSVYMQPS